ncbi:MAG TPA: CRISPR-associated helicase Cas3', partial [Sedimenticola sp.]|nr:CRISPR-associated helicase Cas3' [Sedimenticola sp.]
LTGIDISRLAAGMQEPMLSDRRRQASWLLAGLAVLCDWLGSDQNLFTYRSTPLPLATYWSETALPTACQAVEQAGIIPQTPHSHLAPAALFPYLEQASPLQRQCARVALGDGPRLFILEEATGAGKTEAALILTHRLMAAGRARGLYIGLPTMATANAMYERMGPFYRRLYRDTAHPSLILSHSARHLSARFRQSLLNGQQEEQATPGQETVSAQCNRWLADSRKKALLADVGIGTLDQALLAVVAVRHQSLRLFGLLGKVLILDEVHAYDAYTGRLLHNLLRFHAALGGDAILLSATLTRNQRQALIDAFCAGAGTPGSNLAESTAYPLLTHAGSPSGPEEYPLATRATVRRRVAVDFLHDESGILRVIQEATSQGQCVCWIRNTVQDARDAWERLREAIWLDPGQLHLFHSRYTLGDRLAIEQETLGRFGKTSAAEARRGQVLIATQVVEQSLDIDFDRMISDLAPVDLLIQRAGRLQRHHRDPEGNPLPAGSADRRGTPELLVHAPPFSEHPDQKWYKEKFPRADHVYSHTVILWRTQRILQAQGGWRMPEDAREMLETVYDPEGEIPPGLSDNDLEAEGNRFSERDLAGDAALSLNACYGNNGHWDEEAHLQTRLGEATRPLYLARWDGVRLTPWFEEGRYHWDLSSVSIPHHRLSRVADPEDPALQTALQALRETEKLFDEESLVMPLQAVDGRWTGQGMDDRDRRVEMQYDPKIGLEFLFQAGVSR